MALLQRSESGIGRGETAESQFEAPFLMAFILMSAAAVAIFHLKFQNESYSIALGISLLVFAITITRVEFGLYVLTVAMLLSPEIEAGNVGSQEERGLNIRYDDVLILIIFMGMIVRQAFEGNFVFWRRNPINAGILAYLGICVISSLRALRIGVGAWDPSVAFFIILKMIEYYLVFAIVSHVIVSAKEMRRQLVVFFVVSAIVCAYGIMTIGTMDRISAPFEAGGTEPNTLGGYLLIVLCLSACLSTFSPTLKWRMTFLGLMVLSFVPFVMTLSRASYVSLFVAFMVLGLALRKPVILVAILLVVLTAPFTMPPEVVERVNYTFQSEGVALEPAGIDTGITIDKSTHERLYVWQKVQFNLTVWPWLGGGVSWDTVLDSQYARVLIETGILGMAAFSFLLFRLLRTSWQAYRWNSYWVFKGLSLGMFVSTVGLMVHSLGTISFLIVRIMEPFWMLMAFVVVAREIALVDYRQRLDAYQKSQTPAPEAPNPIPIGSELPAPT